MTATNFDKMLTCESEFLRPYARSLTRNTEDSQDLFQQTIMKALINRDKFVIGTNQKAWLYTLMRNTFINEYRRNRKFTKVASTLPDDLIYYDARKNPVNVGMSNMRVKEIKREIEKLPKTFRQSFELYYLGYRYASIARMLNEPLGTIKSKIHMARKILISKLER